MRIQIFGFVCHWTVESYSKYMLNVIQNYQSVFFFFHFVIHQFKLLDVWLIFDIFNFIFFCLILGMSRSWCCTVIIIYISLVIDGICCEFLTVHAGSGCSYIFHILKSRLFFFLTNVKGFIHVPTLASSGNKLFMGMCLYFHLKSSLYQMLLVLINST